MTPIFRLTFLFFIFCCHSYGQGAMPQIKGKWGQVATLLQERSSIITDLAKELSTSKVDKKQNGNLKALAIDLQNYLGSLKELDSVSVGIAAAKNSKLLQTINATLIEIDNHEEIKSKQRFATIQAKLEGCENSIKNASREYNDVCREYHRTDLVLILDYPKATEVRY